MKCRAAVSSPLCDWGFPGGEVLVHVHFIEAAVNLKMPLIANNYQNINCAFFFFISTLGIYYEETLGQSVKVYTQGCHL